VMKEAHMQLHDLQSPGRARTILEIDAMHSWRQRHWTHGNAHNARASPRLDRREVVPGPLNAGRSGTGRGKQMDTPIKEGYRCNTSS